MIRYRIEIPRALRDLIRHLPPGVKAKVKAALRSIADDPYRAKDLRDELAGLRSYRIGRSRIIFRIVGSVVQIVALGPRADIYERAATELSKTLRKGNLIDDFVRRKFPIGEKQMHERIWTVTIPPIVLGRADKVIK